MENKKMTKRHYFTALLAVEEVQSNTAMVEFIEHELELLAKKNSSERKPTAVQKENADLKVAILDGMEANRVYTVTEMIKSIDAIGDLTNQKVSAILRQMATDGTVKRTEEKKKAYFSKV